MQMTIFDVMREPEIKPKTMILGVGDEIGRVVLGELRIAKITKIEGLPRFPFYRTDSGSCYSYEEGLKTIDELRKLAAIEITKYKTIQPHDLAERITVEYAPRNCDGRVGWAQIGIYENMLFWKEDCTYQFLEPYSNEKELINAYKKRKEKILRVKYKIVSEEHEMRRLYWSARNQFYADAEYVQFNG